MEAEAVHPDHAGERWRNRVEPRDELGYEQRVRPPAREGVFRPPHAGVGLEGEPAEMAQDLPSPPATELEPESVAQGRGQQRDADGRGDVELTHTREGARAQEERDGREGQADLLG